MHLLDPKNDLTFKLLLTRRTELLADMLSGVLARPILSVTAIDPKVPAELPTDKEVILDVRAELEDGLRVDVEMQRRVPPALRQRLVYYTARDYADQLDRGDGYHHLSPTAVIAWLVEPLFPTLGFHSTFELRDRLTHARFTDQLAIHLLQLGARPREPATGYAAIVQRWARFFVADLAELTALASEDPIMTIAKQTLEELSRDPITRRLAREREDAKKLYRLDLDASQHQGHLEGQRKVLLELLTQRFGPLPSTARARIHSATAEQLDAWTGRLLAAQTLDEALAI